MLGFGLGSSLKTAKAIQLPKRVTNAKSIDFDSTNDYIALPASNTLITGTNVTFACWAKTTDTDRTYLIANQKGSGSTNLSLTIHANETTGAAGVISAIIWDGTSAHGYVVYDGNVDDSAWHHYAFTTTSSAQVLYLDGVAVATGTLTFGNAASSDLSAIGAIGAGHFMGGNIAQVGIWSAVLTQAQVQSVMEKTYDELNTDDKTSLVSYWPLDEAVQVLNFDGSSQINLASTIELAEDTAWSISFWQHQGGDDDSYIIGMNSESPARYKIRHRSDLIRVYFPSGSSNDLNATDVLTEWTHIVITCDGTDSSNLKYYLEGSLEDTESATNTAFNIDTIGGAGGTGFDGKLAQVAVYDKALSAGEVTAQLNLGASGDWSSDSNLLGYWKMDNATTVTDLSGKGNHGTVDGATLVDGYLDDSTGNGNFGDMQ